MNPLGQCFGKKYYNVTSEHKTITVLKRWFRVSFGVNSCTLGWSAVVQLTYNSYGNNF